MSTKPSQRPRPNTAAKQKPKYKPPNMPNSNGGNNSSKAMPVAASASPAISAEAKRDSRMQRQKEALAAGQRRKRMQLIRRGAIIAAVLIVIGAIAAAFYINEANKPGQGVAMQPSPHIRLATDAHAAYSTDPPTSGPHVPEVPSWGVHTDAIAKELQVHALEDGGVVINYRPDIDKATLDKLTALTKNYDKDVLLVPYKELSNPIVLTAWRRIDRLDAFDAARMTSFISTFAGKDHHGESGS